MRVKIQKATGAIFLALAAMFGFLAVFMYLDPVEGKTAFQSLIPGLFFGAVCLVPGFWLYSSAKKAQRQRDFEERLLGYVRGFDRFSSAELAEKIGHTEMEVEGHIARLSARTDIELVFHRPDRTWYHLNRVADEDDVVRNCKSCGADVGTQLVFKNETVACTYCGKSLT